MRLRVLDSATYIDSYVVPGEFPGVEIQPVVGNLDLVAVDDLLFEDTITISQTIAPGRVVQACQTVEETGGQTSQTTVT